MVHRRPTAGALTRAITGLALVGLMVAGCGDRAPAATSSPRVTAAPTTTPTADPSAQARADAKVAFEAFVKLLHDPERTFRIDQTSALRTPAGQATMTERVDVDGEDFTGEMTIKLGGVSARLGYIACCKRFWLRLDKADWKTVSRDEVSASDGLAVLFAAADARRVDFRDTKVIDGTTLLHYRNREPIAYQTDASPTPGSIDQLDIYLAKDGTPVRVDFRSSAIARLGPAIKGRIDADNVLLFSRIGKPVTIKPPT